MNSVSVAPPEIAEPALEFELLTANPWACIVWDDPVNLMSYVTFVFVSYFHYSREKSTELMLRVHNDGKAAVNAGTREEMERDVAAMHSYGLWATLESSD
jgi:ATP-dependent Clp protease adaptor protein ClpS